MRRREFAVLGVVAVMAACSRPAEAPAGGADPAETIRVLYDRYLTDPAVTTFPTLEEQAPWSAAMRAELQAMTARSEALQEPILDFDPFVIAQDWEISAIAVTTDAVVEGSHAVVRAHFVNGGQDVEVVHDLVWEEGGWRVDNIRGDGWDLRQIVTGP